MHHLRITLLAALLTSSALSQTNTFPASGNVGIGTTTPKNAIEVSGFTAAYVPLGGDTNPAIRITNSNSAEFNEKAELQFSVGGGLAVTSAISALYSDWASPGGGLVGSDLVFSTKLASGNLTERLRIDKIGNVGIGTTNPQHKLAVNGTIKAKEVIVETTGWSDYVFADDYRLAPLAEVEAHIKTNKHLPGIPSAAQVAETGANLGDVQAALLAKVEELTLHLIAQEKKMNAIESETAQQKQALQSQVDRLRKRVQELETR